MSDPLYPYSRGVFPGGDGAPPPPPRYSDIEVDLIAARYADDQPPYPSSTNMSPFDSHVGAFDSKFGAFNSHVGAFDSKFGAFDSHVGAFDSAFAAFDPHVGAFDSHDPNVEDSYPERPGKPDCPYFVKSNKCIFKSKCKFNHPKEKLSALEAGSDNEQSLIADSAVLPVRPSEPVCSVRRSTIASFITINYLYFFSLHNAYLVLLDDTFSRVLQGEVDCSFYMKTGSCKYGSTCRFNHPDRPVVDIALMAPPVQTTLPTPAPIVSAANMLQIFDFHATHMPIEPVQIIYPQRPGETVCDFYMKTGFCKYSQKCKFHHPMNRSASDANEIGDPVHPLTLTLAGLPRREDAEACAFYMRSGTCRYGAHCKFDHPPPQEAIAKLQAAGNENGKEKEGKEKADDKEGLSVVQR
nr:unnamed protein product [Digitaria exilis]